MAGRRQKSRRAKSHHVRETPDEMRSRVLGAFERWLDARVPAGPAPVDLLYTVRTACQFKDSSLDSPNPSDWSPDLVDEVIGDLFPRKLIGVDPDYVAAIVPAMHVYLDFLTETGRWKPGNDVLATGQALDGLVAELPLRIGNPMYQGAAGRMMQMAVDEGIDITDEGAMAEVIERFNAMPEDFRRGPTAGDGFDDVVEAAASIVTKPVRPIMKRGREATGPWCHAGDGRGAHREIRDRRKQQESVAGTTTGEKCRHRTAERSRAWVTGTCAASRRVAR